MKYLFIDGSNLIYRAYHVSNEENKNGLRISGIINSLKMIQRLVTEFQPERIIIAWDEMQCQARLDLHPGYKQQRDKYRNPEDTFQIKENILYLKQMIRVLPIKQISVPFVEADDIIGFLCTKIKSKKIIISNDKDYLQLVNESTDLVMPLNKNRITFSNIDDYLGFPHKYFILHKALVGDSSDNIPGIHGVGPVTATKLILENLKNGEIPIRDDWKKILDRNIKLMTINLLTSTKDKKRIIKQYQDENNKKINFKKFQELLKNQSINVQYSELVNFEKVLNRLSKIHKLIRNRK